MTRILIAIDESDASRKAAGTAAHLFEGADFVAVNVASVRVPWTDVHAWGGVYPWPFPGADDYVAEMQTESTAHAIDTAASAAHDAGLDDAEAVAAVELGDTAKAIIDAAHEHDVDLIVVGWTDKSWFSRVLDGSVARDLVRRADIPVLVCK